MSEGEKLGQSREEPSLGGRKRNKAESILLRFLEEKPLKNEVIQEMLSLLTGLRRFLSL